MTTPKFHRLTDTKFATGDYVRTGYNSPIPNAVVDWLNNPPGDTTQAPASGPIVNAGNPYNGSYLIGGKEDAVDAYANRSAAALGRDIDDIDDSVRRGIATLSSVAWTSPTPAVSTYTFAAGTIAYMGNGSAPAECIEIIDSSNYASLVGSGGQKIQPSTWTYSGAIDAAGFAEITSVTFNDVIPGGVSCLLFYGAKTAVAEIPRDALLRYLHSVPEISNVVQQMLLRLHAPVGSTLQEAWNATWDSTIAELTLSGLNDRYNCADHCEATDTVPYTVLQEVQAFDPGWPVPAVNLPGAGGWMVRRGMAPSSISLRTSGLPLETDKLNACWRAVIADAATAGGSVGYAVQGGRNTYSSDAERGAGFAAQLYHHPVKMLVGDWYSGDAYTVLPVGANATMLYSAGELTCTLTELTTWFTKDVDGVLRTGINTGVDMLEVIDHSGLEPAAKYWVIHRFIDQHTCVLRTLTGAVAPVGRVNGGYPAATTTTDVTLAWHSTAHSVSDGAAERRLQLAVQGGLYDPGHLEATSPANYGTAFYPGLPNVGVNSNYSSNHLQHFDIGVVSIYGNVLGQLLPQPPVKSGAAFPVPEPDVALFIGVKSPLVDTFGQTADVANAMVLSNGMAYFPKVFTSAIGCYDPLSSASMRVESHLIIDVPGSPRSVIYGTGGLTLHSDADNDKLKVTLDPDLLTLAHTSDLHARVPITVTNIGVCQNGELASDSQRWNPLPPFNVDVTGTTFDITVDPRLYSEVRFSEWSSTDPTDATVTVKLTADALQYTGMSGTQNDRATGLAGRVYRLGFAIDQGLLGGSQRTVNIVFAGGTSDIVIESFGPGFVILGETGTNHYLMLEITVFGNGANKKSYAVVRELFVHNHFLWS